MNDLERRIAKLEARVEHLYVMRDEDLEAEHERESEQTEYEQYADGKGREIAAIMDDPAPAPSEGSERKHHLVPVGSWKARCERCGWEGPDDAKWWRQFECAPPEDSEGEVEPELPGDLGFVSERFASGGAEESAITLRPSRERQHGVVLTEHVREVVQRLQRELEEVKASRQEARNEHRAALRQLDSAREERDGHYDAFQAKREEVDCLKAKIASDSTEADDEWIMQGDNAAAVLDTVEALDDAPEAPEPATEGESVEADHG
jgi:hypothetical protein